MSGQACRDPFVDAVIAAFARVAQCDSADPAERKAEVKAEVARGVSLEFILWAICMDIGRADAKADPEPTLRRMLSGQFQLLPEIDLDRLRIRRKHSENWQRGFEVFDGKGWRPDAEFLVRFRPEPGPPAVPEPQPPTSAPPPKRQTEPKAKPPPVAAPPKPAKKTAEPDSELEAALRALYGANRPKKKVDSILGDLEEAGRTVTRRTLERCLEKMGWTRRSKG